MDNEERIKKWREQRLGGGAAGVADLDLAEAAAGKKRARAERIDPEDFRGGGTALPPTADLPDDVAIEEARLAIMQRRNARWRKLVARVGLFLVLPLLIILLYVELIATPLYQGEAVFTVQTSSDSAASPTAGLFAVTAGSSTVVDAFRAREYILSRPMMDYMQNRYGFLDHFTSSKVDPLTRLNGAFGLNSDPYEYYLKRVRVAVDVQEGLLRLYVQARTQDDAIRFGNAILNAAQAQVNATSQKISEDQIESLTQDVQGAERQVADTRRSLAAVQARRGELSPEQTATAVYQLISQLELQRADAERERNALLDQGLTNSPLLPRLSSRVEELQAQISEQRQRLANPGGTSLATTLNEFESASARKDMAQTRWQTTLNTLQQAYLRILQQRRYFVVVVGMSASHLATVRDVLGIAWPILLMLALLYGIVLTALHLGLRDRVRTIAVNRAVARWKR